MRLRTRALLAVGIAGALVAPAAASAHTFHGGHHGFGGRSGVPGYVYVNDNTATSNTVAGFRRWPDGSLTPLPGSPFATGGGGTGTLVGSQGSLQSAFGGRFVLAADAGSNQVSVLAVGPAGHLSPVPGGTVASGGVEA